MWPPLSKLLERLGRLRLFRSSITAPPGGTWTVGEARASDALGGHTWRQFLAADALYDACGPHPESPWLPFHTPTLFAALESTHSRAPSGDPELPSIDQRLAPERRDPILDTPAWLAPGNLAIIDLEGPRSVAYGAWLADMGGQPVCTFDNWPHGRGLLKPEHTLAALLRYAPVFQRRRADLTPDAPALWLCDRTRLLGRVPIPTDFDNRYYLDESALPGPGMMKQHGVHTLVVITDPKANALAPDLEAWLFDRHKDGFNVLHAPIDAPHLEATPLTPHRPSFSGYSDGLHRSDAGGFGVLIPEPSSSGG
jgi:hypothetical protein